MSDEIGITKSGWCTEAVCCSFSFKKKVVTITQLDSFIIIKTWKLLAKQNPYKIPRLITRDLVILTQVNYKMNAGWYYLQ